MFYIKQYERRRYKSLADDKIEEDRYQKRIKHLINAIQVKYAPEYPDVPDEDRDPNVVREEQRKLEEERRFKSIDILKKPYEKRNQSEVDYLYIALKSLPYFSKILENYSKATMYEILKVLRLETVKKNHHIELVVKLTDYRWDNEIEKRCVIILKGSAVKLIGVGEYERQESIKIGTILGEREMLDNRIRKE